MKSLGKSPRYLDGFIKNLADLAGSWTEWVEKPADFAGNSTRLIENPADLERKWHDIASSPVKVCWF